ncbi:restriction endonuclease subunit S [Mucilaginibacter sp. UYCu711]|uniref:restriction endonuclease subunit S n=1 Tax=Mucilaginibacter sp. UYCu711 TaxID=3156339 RepID=UPI003D1E2B35
MVKTYIENIKHTAVRSKIFYSLAKHKHQPIFKVVKFSSGDYLPSSAMVVGDYFVYGGGGKTNKSHNEYNIHSRTLGIGRVGARCGCVFEIQPKSWVTDNALFATDISPEYNINFLIEYLNFCEINQFANTSAQPVISLKRISNIMIPIIDLDQQKEIVDVLKTFELENFNIGNDKYGLKQIIALMTSNELLAIELNDQLETLKKLRQQLLQDAIQGKLVEQDLNDEPANILLQQIKLEREHLTRSKKLKNGKKLLPFNQKDVPFVIPSNWAWCRLGEIINYCENLDIHKKFSPETNINYIDIDAIDNSEHIIKEIKVRKVSELSTRARRVLEQGYILYSTVRPYLKNMAFVKVDKPNLIGSTGFSVFKTIIAFDKYIFNFLLSPDLNEKYKKLMVGFNSPSITNEQFENTFVPLPPLAEQYRIVQKVEELMQICDILDDSIRISQQQNQQLQQQALRGLSDNKTYKKHNFLVQPDNQYKTLLLSAEIVWKLSQKQTLGHVKLQKMIYLCDRAQNMNLPVKFLRRAMGPYDRELQLYIDNELEEREWFKYNEDEPLKYKMLKNAGGHKQDFKELFQNDLEAIYHLIDIFENTTSARIEIVATLYACWERMLEKKQLINDASLIAEFYDWSEHKSKYTNAEIIDALRWMEVQGIVPRSR